MKIIMRVHGFALCALLLFASAASADPILKDGDVLAICGDSITEQREYSVLVETYLLACQPVKNIRVVQMGWMGESMPAFAARIGSDVLPFHPSVVTMFYGINEGRPVLITPQIIQLTHDAISSSITALKAGGVRTIVLMSPGAVDSFAYARRGGADPAAYNKSLGILGGDTAALAKQQSCAFVDLHMLMMDTMAKAKARFGERFAFVGTDGVHPGEAGNLVIAYGLLKALGCDGDLGTITLDLAGNHNDATRGHRIVSAENGVVEIESRRIPFCFSGDPTSSNADRSMIDLLPFNQELNRLTLKVIGAGKGQFRITWGDRSKDFSSDELAVGINLAAEFPDGPFNEAFDRIRKAVQAQQEFESPLVKTLLHSIPVQKQVVPEESQSLDRIAAEGIAHDKALFDAAALQASQPIHHTIKIEPVP